MLLLPSLKHSVIFIFQSIFVVFTWELFARQTVYKLLYNFNRFHQSSYSNIVFNQLDINADGHLSFLEWIPYFYQNSGEGVGTTVDGTTLDTSPLHVSNGLLDPSSEVKSRFEEDDHIFSVKASFKPLVLNSATKDFTVENIVHPGSMQGLLNWQVPNIPWKNFASKQFAMFLPPSETVPSPGQVWWIVAPQQTQQIPSDYYEPQPVSSSIIFLQELLKMFHPRVSLLTRFPPQGTAAVVRAANQDMLDIFFRSHVEFQLNEKPALPFWFTPAQFEGRLIIQRNASRIDYFSMSLPNSRPLNVDMEWLYGTKLGEMEVDLGFVPEMALKSSSASIPSSQLGSMKYSFIHGVDSDHSTPSYKWTKEITENEAWSLLEKRFYTFKKVPYYNITGVFDQAVSSDKLVHTLVLFGSLDDQSC